MSFQFSEKEVERNTDPLSRSPLWKNEGSTQETEIGRQPRKVGRKKGSGEYGQRNGV
jgi:hypothetical protein